MPRIAFAALIATVAILLAPAVASAAQSPEIAAQEAIVQVKQQHVTTLQGLIKTTTDEIAARNQHINVLQAQYQALMGSWQTAPAAGTVYHQIVQLQVANQHALQRLNHLLPQLASAQSELATAKAKLAQLKATQP